MMRDISDAKLSAEADSGTLKRALHVVLAALMAVAGPLWGAESTTEQGLIAFQQGHYLQASRLLADAVRSNPRDEHARTFLALARAATGHCPEAVPDLTDRFQKSENRDLARLAGLALAQCLVAQGDTAKAAPIAGQLEAKYPDDADVLYQAARVHMSAFNDATRRMFEKTPASYRVNQLSGEIFETQNKFTEAAAEYRKAIEKNPRALNLHFRLGRAILLESHSPDALATAQKEFEADLTLNAGGLAPKAVQDKYYFARRPEIPRVVDISKQIDKRVDAIRANVAKGPGGHSGSRLRAELAKRNQRLPLLGDDDVTADRN